jgi:hypothetical protein
MCAGRLAQWRAARPRVTDDTVLSAESGLRHRVRGGHSPIVLGRAWQWAPKLSDDDVRTGNLAMIFGSASVLSPIAAFVFAMFLGPVLHSRSASGRAFRRGWARSPPASASTTCS